MNLPATPLGLRIEPLTLKEDSRGNVCEPLDAALLAQQQNVHVVLTRPGGVRGNHCHQQATEIFAVYGPALVRIRAQGQVRDYRLAAGQAHRFTIPPGVPHAIQNTGTEMGVLIAFSTAVHDPERPDTVRDVLIEP